MLKIGALLLCCVIYTMHAHMNNETCRHCGESGTYKCGEDGGCECHVNFFGMQCLQQMADCSPSECSNQGSCSYDRGLFKCLCHEGFFGRRCEHKESEVEHIYEIEKKLEREKCGEDIKCMPPVLTVTCSSSDLDDCDDQGTLRPFKQCPYPHYCWEKFKNNKCDWECNRPECQYDAFECSTSPHCPLECRRKSRVCSSKCSIKVWEKRIRDEGRIPYSEFDTPEIIQVSFSITKQFWWDNMEEIISNISEPLRTPLRYVAAYNKRLERSRSANSRGKRSIGGGQTVDVNLQVSTVGCWHSEDCARGAKEAGQILAAASSQHGTWQYVRKIRIVQKEEPIVNQILAVCIVVIAIPVILIGYRILSAPVWFPPKSCTEDAVMLSTFVPPPQPSGIPTILHEEAYSPNMIPLPIRVEWVNGMDEQGRTPLFWLMSSEKKTLWILADVDELVKAGANVNHSDHKGHTPLSIAITCVRPSVCARLVHWGADPAACTHSGASCLHLAVAQDDYDCVQWLLSFDSVRNNVNEVDESDRTPLAMAAQGGIASAKITELLISAGADVLYQGNQSTMWRYRGRTALHWAAQFDNIEVLKILLDHRSDVNCVDTEGCSALHFAVKRGSEAAVRMLLEAHASTEIANEMGTLPLTIARKTGIQPLIELLTWYTDVRKIGLDMKTTNGRKRHQRDRSGDSGTFSDMSKRSCSSSVYSMSYDGMSTHSALSSNFSPSPSDCSSIRSETSSFSAYSNHSSSMLDPSSIITSPSSSMPPSSFYPSKSRPPALPPIDEKPPIVLSFDTVKSESYIPPGVYPPPSSTNSEEWMNGMHKNQFDSIAMSPFSERSVSGIPDSPIEHLGASHWTDNDEKMNDGYTNEDLQEFFVNLQY